MKTLEQASEILLACNGLNTSDLDSVLAVVMRHHVDYADLYVQSARHESWSMENGEVKAGSFFNDQGFGIRAVREDETAFAYSQRIDARQMLVAARSVRSVASSGARSSVTSRQWITNRSLYPAPDPITACPTEIKVALLQYIERKARALDERVTQVIAQLEVNQSVMMVMRHDGRLAADIRPMVRITLNVYVTQGKRTESSNGSLGGRTALALITDTKLDAEIEMVVNSAVVKLQARPAPCGNMPVIIASGWPGILLHEAMGHGFEGDFNRLGSSVYAGSIGQRVAPPDVTIVDNATLPNLRGSLDVDDEGEEGQNTLLIENGVVKGYMQDALNARLMKQAPTGNGRRQSYAHLPLPRMTNTYMLPGRYAPQELIASVNSGLYLVELGSGQVDITSGQYTFECELAYRIENGKLTYPIKGATVTGNGPETLRSISMVGNDLALDRGRAMCVKFGQSIPVSVGQPTLKVEQLLVGGTNVE